MQTAAAQECTSRLDREEHGIKEGARTLAVLDAKMRHSSLTMSMLDACMFSEAGPIICRMSMMAIQPLLSFHNVRAPLQRVATPGHVVLPATARAGRGARGRCGSIM